MTTEETAIVIKGESANQLIARAEDNSTAALVRMALERNMGIDVIERLLQLRREEEAYQAEKAATAAKAAFAAEAPTVAKDKTAQRGSAGTYKYASIGNCIETIGPILAKHGFAWDWETEQDDKLVSVTCVLTHELGHKIRRHLAAPPDKGPGRSPIQEIASTISYLERYTFLAATGCATRDQPDSDGKRAREAAPEELPGQTVYPKRAREAIKVFSSLLGDDAQGLMEQCLGKQPGDWSSEDFEHLTKTVWPARKQSDSRSEQERLVRQELAKGR